MLGNLKTLVVRVTEAARPVPLLLTVALTGKEVTWLLGIAVYSLGVTPVIETSGVKTSNCSSLTSSTAIAPAQTPTSL